MVKSFADWVFNLLVWGSIVAVLALLYETLALPGFVTAANPIGALIAAAVIAVLAALWPRLSS